MSRLEIKKEHIVEKGSLGGVKIFDVLSGEYVYVDWKYVKQYKKPQRMGRKYKSGYEDTRIPKRARKEAKWAERKKNGFYDYIIKPKTEPVKTSSKKLS